MFQASHYYQFLLLNSLPFLCLLRFRECGHRNSPQILTCTAAEFSSFRASCNKEM
jgi:hypothetical protein